MLDDNTPLIHLQEVLSRCSLNAASPSDPVTTPSHWKFNPLRASVKFFSPPGTPSSGELRIPWEMKASSTLQDQTHIYELHRRNRGALKAPWGVGRKSFPSKILSWRGPSKRDSLCWEILKGLIKGNQR